jgi:hypothetical protein
LLFILALIILGLIIVKGRGRKILDLIGSRKIDVQLAGNKLSIGDAIEAIDDETKQSLDDFRKSHEQIQTINVRLDALEAYLRYVPLKSTRSPDTPPSDLPVADDDFLALMSKLGPNSGIRGLAQAFKPSPKSASTPTEHDKPSLHESPTEGRQDEIFKRMLRALSDTKFRWRTVERLAIEAGVDEREARDILASHHPNAVVLGKSKTGKIIARLPDR